MIVLIGGMRIVRRFRVNVAGMEIAAAVVKAAAEIVRDIAAEVGMSAQPNKAHEELQYEDRSAQGGAQGE